MDTPPRLHLILESHLGVYVSLRIRRGWAEAHDEFIRILSQAILRTPPDLHELAASAQCLSLLWSRRLLIPLNNSFQLA